MSTTEIDLIKQIIQISIDAGNEILKVYNNSQIDVNYKEDQSPLTMADMASHRIIKQKLKLLFPKIPIISEEESDIPFEIRSKWGKYWLVDPLDGTKEFINRNGEFTTNIALIENNRTSMGVLHIPCTKETYYGDYINGSYLLDKNNHVVPLNSLRKNDKRILLVSRSHLSGDQKKFLADQDQFLVMNRGSSLKFCMIASGEADVYIRLGPTSEWDIAAGESIVKFSGGWVTHIDRSEIKFNKKDDYINDYFVAARNEQLLDSSLDFIKAMQSKDSV